MMVDYVFWQQSIRYSNKKLDTFYRDQIDSEMRPSTKIIGAQLLLTSTADHRPLSGSIRLYSYTRGAFVQLRQVVAYLGFQNS